MFMPYPLSAWSFVAGSGSIRCPYLTLLMASPERERGLRLGERSVGLERRRDQVDSLDDWKLGSVWH
jgi:hypothetical protein